MTSIISSYVVAAQIDNDDSFDATVQIHKNEDKYYINIRDGYNPHEIENSFDKMMYYDFNGRIARLVFFHHTIELEFDSKSASSLTKFKEDLEQCLNTKFNVIRYPSGNLRYCGDIKDDKPNGKCIEYYDSENNDIKYCGEFEDGLYDGEGDFYSENKSIKVHINEISKGEPVHDTYAYIQLNDEGKQEIKLGEYTDLDLTDEDFCVDIAKDEIEDYGDKIFNELGCDEQTEYLKNELDKIVERIDDLENKTNKVSQSSNALAYFMCIFFVIVAFLLTKMP